MTKIIKILLGVFALCAVSFILVESYRIYPVFAQENGGPTAQTTPELNEESLPSDFDWAAFTKFEARLVQCEEIDQQAWETGETIQVQRCIGPSPYTFLENPNLERLPQVENLPQPAGIQPRAVEAAPVSSK